MPSDDVGTRISLCSGGCLSFSRLSEEKTAGVSSEQMILTAAQMFPSSSLDDTAAAFVASGLFAEGGWSALRILGVLGTAFESPN